MNGQRHPLWHIFVTVVNIPLDHHIALPGCVRCFHCLNEDGGLYRPTQGWEHGRFHLSASVLWWHLGAYVCQWLWLALRTESCSREASKKRTWKWDYGKGVVNCVSFILCLAAKIPRIPLERHREPDWKGRKLRIEYKDIRILIIGPSLSYYVTLSKASISPRGLLRSLPLRWWDPWWRVLTGNKGLFWEEWHFKQLEFHSIGRFHSDLL